MMMVITAFGATNVPAATTNIKLTTSVKKIIFFKFFYSLIFFFFLYYFSFLYLIMLYKHVFISGKTLDACMNFMS